MMKRILVVDDEANMRRILEATLIRDGYDVDVAENGSVAMEMMRKNPAHVVITDIKMPVMDGMTLLKEINRDHPDVPIIMLTAHGTVENAVEAMKQGAFDYISKPFDMEELHHSLMKACATYQSNIEEVHDTEPLMIGGIVAASQQLKSVLGMVERVADSPTTILITGESGTGKELIAQLIHHKSSRCDSPFIKVNCAAIPETLLESEFFGYERGAFSGAVTSKPGRFELANGGTLFLDEIGEISREMQVKLLRVIQELEFERVGGIKTIKVDVRLVVATNLDLGVAVESGRFRQDLFYRLNVVPIHLPPLRERPDDIPPLVHHFINRYNKRLNRQIKGITPEAMSVLVRHAWPGNIRELENFMERSILLSSSNMLTIDSFPNLNSQDTDHKTEQPNGTTLHEIIQNETERLEKQLLENALRETHGNVTRAAKILGLSRKGLQLKMKRYSLQSRSGSSDTDSS